MQPADLNFSIAEMTAGKGEKNGESSEIASLSKDLNLADFRPMIVVVPSRQSLFFRSPGRYHFFPLFVIHCFRH
jgi:hypothetical protein